VEDPSGAWEDIVEARITIKAEQLFLIDSLDYQEENTISRD